MPRPDWVLQTPYLCAAALGLLGLRLAVLLAVLRKHGAFGT